MSEQQSPTTEHVLLVIFHKQSFQIELLYEKLEAERIVAMWPGAPGHILDLESFTKARLKIYASEISALGIFPKQESSREQDLLKKIFQGPDRQSH